MHVYDIFIDVTIKYMRLALNQSLTLSGGSSQATALLAIAAADYKNKKNKKNKLLIIVLSVPAAN